MSETKSARKEVQLSECEIFQRRVRYILNRLTPDNIVKLVVEFLNLPLDSERNLKDCIEIVWFKCLEDHMYSPLYAKLCKVMSETRVELQFMPDRYLGFGAALVKKCQRELNRDFKSHIDVAMLQDEINRISDPKKRKKLEASLEDKLLEARRKYMGNLIFILELFKLDMVDEKILFDAVDKLFKRVYDGHDENIEFICKIMSTMAPKLKRYESIKTSMIDINRILNDYVHRLETLESGRVKPRLRFAIRDVLEMKDKNWEQPTTLETTLHRLEEIRADFEQELEQLVKSQTLLDSLSDHDSDPEASLPTIKEMVSFDFAKHVFEEFTVQKDHVHAVKDIERLKSADIREFVRDLVSIGFYKDAKSRESVGLLLFKCLKENVLSRENFTNGMRLFFRSFKEREEDQDNDSQDNVSNQIAEILSQLFQFDFIRVDCLIESFEPIFRRKVGCEVLCETLKRASERLGTQTVNDILKVSNCNLANLINEFPNGHEIFQLNSLDWALSFEKRTEDSVELFKKRLNRLMNAVSDLETITAVFKLDELKSSEFLRALVEIAFERCWNGEKLDLNHFKFTFASFLRKFIVDDQKELEALRAVQSLNVKLGYPKNLMKDVFEILQSEKIVREKTFEYSHFERFFPNS